MKRLLQYATIFAILTLTACEYDKGTWRAPNNLGKTLWDIAYPDLKRVNEVLDIVASYNYYLTIEEMESAEEYKLRKLNNPTEITVDGNTHTLTYDTGYGTTHCIIFEMHADKWQVTRSGGNGFTLTITSDSEGKYIVDIESIYFKESSGWGDLEGSLTYSENGEPEIGITGTIVMVDNERSKTHPLTITTKISEIATFDFYSNIESGTMRITAEDALYGSKDEIKAWIVERNNIPAVTIRCLDDVTNYNL